MASQERHLGHATLDLLAEEWSVQIMRELFDDPVRPCELEQRLPAAPHAALMRCLTAMHHKGVVTHERQPGPPPSARYGLTRAGRQTLEILDAAKRWERRWTPKPGSGRAGVRLIGDQRTREILLAVGARPISATELQQRLSRPVSRSTMRERLAGLVSDGLLTRYQRGRVVAYMPTESARELALVAIAAARWEWKWDRPNHPVAAADVAGVLHLFAPAARLPVKLGGTCRMSIDGATGPAPNVYIAARGRRVATLTRRPSKPPEAVCHATPQGWCDALLLQRWCGVISTGNGTLMAAVLASVSAALLS